MPLRFASIAAADDSNELKLPWPRYDYKMILPTFPGLRLELHRSARIGILELARPSKSNAFSESMWEDFAKVDVLPGRTEVRAHPAGKC